MTKDFGSVNIKGSTSGLTKVGNFTENRSISGFSTYTRTVSLLKKYNVAIVMIGVPGTGYTGGRGGGVALITPNNLQTTGYSFNNYSNNFYSKVKASISVFIAGLSSGYADISINELYININNAISATFYNESATSKTLYVNGLYIARQ